MAGTKAGAQKRKAALLGATDRVTPALTPHQDRVDPVYVVAPKRVLKHGDKLLKAGDEVPGAHLWPRLESWLNTGRIVEKA